MIFAVLDLHVAVNTCNNCSFVYLYLVNECSEPDTWFF